LERKAKEEEEEEKKILQYNPARNKATIKKYS